MLAGHMCSVDGHRVDVLVCDACGEEWPCSAVGPGDLLDALQTLDCIIRDRTDPGAALAEFQDRVARARAGDGPSLADQLAADRAAKPWGAPLSDARLIDWLADIRDEPLVAFFPDDMVEPLLAEILRFRVELRRLQADRDHLAVCARVGALGPSPASSPCAAPTWPTPGICWPGCGRIRRRERPSPLRRDGPGAAGGGGGRLSAGHRRAEPKPGPAHDRGLGPGDGRHRPGGRGAPPAGRQREAPPGVGRPGRRRDRRRVDLGAHRVGSGPRWPERVAAGTAVAVLSEQVAESRGLCSRALDALLGEFWGVSPDHRSVPVELGEAVGRDVRAELEARACDQGHRGVDDRPLRQRLAGASPELETLLGEPVAEEPGP